MTTNKHNTVLYTGVTNDLLSRSFEHKQKTYKGFTAKYNADKLVYYEHFSHIEQAIDREKQIKKYSRKKKNELVTKFNPKWKDLWDTLEF